jgi:hypothetical protein
VNPIDIGGLVTTGLGMAAKIVNTIKGGMAYYKDSSLPEVTKLTQVEPYTIVSKDLLNNPETKTVLNSLLSIFTAYYLQAVDILTKVQDVEVVRILDKLNPNRDETGFLLAEGKTWGSMEAYKEGSFRHMSLEGYKFCLPTHSMAMEQDQEDDVTNVTTHVHNNITVPSPQMAGGKGDELAKIDLSDLVNLSVGRLVNVKIAYSHSEYKDGKSETRYATIPMQFRLLVSSVPNDSIVRIATFKNQDLSAGERLHDVKSGKIKFLSDFVMAQDLIDDYKRTAMKDSSGALDEVVRRANNAKKWGLASNNPSLVAASTLVVISDAVARQIEQALGGKLDNPRVRSMFFENTYAMIIAVVSQEWETVTYYTRGIARGATFGFRELEGKSKGTGPDIGDILKALTAGQPPSF